ncbi:MAG: hypothetical protein ACXW05_20265, partial [Gemmatirosa sp.]
SIVAKVTRDRLMHALARRHPAYAWTRNVGYGTPAHLEAITQHGLTAHHRRSFCARAQTALALDDVPPPAIAAAPEGGDTGVRSAE